MVNHKDEYVIYIKDLLFAVLYRWRIVLIVTLALALLLGGWRGISAFGSSTGDPAAQEKYLQQKQLLDKEIARLNQQLEVFGEYITDAPFMSLNPHSVYVTTLQIYLETIQTEVESENNVSDPADALMGAYRALLLSNDSLNSIAAELNMKDMRMEGIMDVNCDQTTNIITVIVRQADSANSTTIPELIKAEINKAQPTVTEIMGNHKISVISSSTLLINDTSLAALQQSKGAEHLKLKEELNARIADQNALVPPSMQTVSATQALKTAIKYAILGGLLGFIAAAVIIVLAHLARNKVYSSRTLEDQTGMHIIGCIPSGKKRNCVDRWLRSLEGRCTEDPQQQGELIAARIHNICGAESVLLLSGTGNAEDRLPVLNALETAGCTIVANGDLLRSVDAVNALGSCTAVVLFEQCGKSLYSSVCETAAQAEAMGKSILGCVLIDG